MLQDRKNYSLCLLQIGLLAGRLKLLIGVLGPALIIHGATLVSGWSPPKKLRHTVAIILVSMAECGRVLPGVLI